MIKNNRKYYQEKEFQFVWCDVCYNKLPEVFTMEGKEIRKAELEMKQNSHTDRETWSQCVLCRRWCHNVCALFNNKLMEQDSTFIFHCPECILKTGENRIRSPIAMYMPKAKGISNRFENGTIQMIAIRRIGIWIICRF